MDMGSKTVLVTGAAGWLGSRLVHTLVRGGSELKDFGNPDADLRVRCLVLPTEDTSLIDDLRDEVEIIRGDLTRPEDCASFCNGAKDAIAFHTAGVIHPSRRAQFYQVNVDGSCNMIESCVAARVKRIIVVSSNSPCGTNPHPDHVFDESSPYRPYLHYGRSKMLMEQEISRVQKRGDIETVTIRAPWFYGPHQPARQSLFFRMIRDGKVPVIGGGENLRSMTYIDNLCQGLVLAAGTEAANGETYWIADDQPYTMNEVVETIEGLLETEFNQECTHIRIALPNLVSELALIADRAYQALGGYNSKLHVLSEMNKTIVCSIEKARTELGYRPVVALPEGMRRSLKWLWEVRGGLR